MMTYRDLRSWAEDRLGIILRQNGSGAALAFVRAGDHPRSGNFLSYDAHHRRRLAAYIQFVNLTGHHNGHNTAGAIRKILAEVDRHTDGWVSYSAGQARWHPDPIPELEVRRLLAAGFIAVRVTD